MSSFDNAFASIANSLTQSFSWENQAMKQLVGTQVRGSQIATEQAKGQALQDILGNKLASAQMVSQLSGITAEANTTSLLEILELQDPVTFQALSQVAQNIAKL